MRKIITDQQARQSPKGRAVLMVLIGSFVLLGVYLVALLLWSGSVSPDHPSQNASREAVTGSATGGTNPSDRTAPANPAYPAPSDATATGSTNAPAKQ
jgi:hypothetical protein